MFTSDEKPAIGKQINRFLLWLDRIPLWWTGILIVVVFFSPYFILGDGCIFEINDQLDESIMNYMLPARHLWDGSTVYPEMLGGVNASGMQPSAILFLPLYCLFSARVAFLTQYMICFVLAFLGMYLLVKESTESSILAVIAGACFCVLPLYPVYGLSEFGIPLVAYAFLCLWKRKRILPALMCTLLFGLTSHLVYTGYVVLGLWLLALLVAFFQKRKNKWPVLGFAELLVTYVIVNWSLILEILVGDSSYVSHREEMVSSATPFFETFWSLFRNSAQHAPSLHKYLILPIVIFLLLGAFCKKEETDRMIYKAAVINFLFLIGIALFYAFCHMTGVLHYFQIHRFYWLYPADWYLEFALAAAVLWRTKVPHTDSRMLPGKLVILAVCLLPTLQLLKVNSGMYLNVNQINNGSGILWSTSTDSGKLLRRRLRKTKKCGYTLIHGGTAAICSTALPAITCACKRETHWSMKAWNLTWRHCGNWDVSTCSPELRSAMPTGWAWNLWDTLKQKTLTGGSGCIDCNSSAHRMTESLPCVQAPRQRFCHSMAELLPQLS